MAVDLTGISRITSESVSYTHLNFKGRAGHPSSKVYLGSAATVTASAITGKIALASEV